MPQIITPSLLDAIFQSYNMSFQQAFSGVKPEWSRVAMEVSSSASAENYGWLGQMPRIREWIGDRQIKALDSFAYQIRNRTFESTVTLKREQIEDDSYGLLKPFMSELGRSVAVFPDELVYPLLNAGFTSNCFDGQYFFDTDHPVKDVDGKDQPVSNMQDGAGPRWFLLDTSRAVKPLVFQKRRAFEFVSKTNPNNSDHVFMRNEYVYGTDGRCNAGFGLWQLAYGSKGALTRANLRAAYQAMTTMKGDYGRPLGIKPNVIVVGPSLQSVARDLLNAELLPVDGVPGGAVGAGQLGMISNTDKGLVEIFVSPWLD